MMNDLHLIELFAGWDVQSLGLALKTLAQP